MSQLHYTYIYNFNPPLKGFYSTQLLTVHLGLVFTWLCYGKNFMFLKKTKLGIPFLVGIILTYVNVKQSFI